MTMTSSSENGIRLLQGVDDILTEEHRKLYGYWLSKKGSRNFPTPSDIDLLDFPREAKMWAIADVVNSGEDFQYRFVGTSIVELLEQEPTGGEFHTLVKTVDSGTFGTDLLKIYHLILNSRAPVINGPTYMPLPNKEPLKFNSLNLPLSHDGETISEILTSVLMLEDS